MIAAMIKDSNGSLLTYTCQYCASLCVEAAIDRWGADGWEALERMGFTVVSVEINETIRSRN